MAGGKEGARIGGVGEEAGGRGLGTESEVVEGEVVGGERRAGGRREAEGSGRSVMEGCNVWSAVGVWKTQLAEGKGGL
jgi:hypothetical protein